MGDRRGASGVWWGDIMASNSLEDLGFDGRTILKWICNEWDGETWIELLWLKIGTGGGRL
jgi:hypothetical protein